MLQIRAHCNDGRDVWISVLEDTKKLRCRELTSALAWGLRLPAAMFGVQELVCSSYKGGTRGRYAPVSDVGFVAMLTAK